jgi:putative phosphonate catabolism associated alcohol dehydrogenase
MPGTSRAAVMTSVDEPLELRRYPLPAVEQGAILVRVLCCTICRSDLHTRMGRRSGPTPVVLGHEIVGEIVELGAGVAHDIGDRPLKVGDRVTWTITDSCGKCYYCREKGLPMKCLHVKKYGHDTCERPPHLEGGLAEYCYIGPGTCVVKVPDNLTNEEAAPANCALATALAGWDTLDLRPLENALIQGAGALGIYATALACHFGCNRIIVTDVLDHRLDFAKEFGATDVINTSGMTDDEIVAAVQSLTGYGVDVAMEVAGVPSLVSVGLRSLRKGGRMALCGTSFAGARFTYDASDIIWRWLQLRGIHNYDAKHLQLAIDFLSRSNHRFPFHKLVTHRYPLEDINEAMGVAESGAGLRVAVLPR